jgi:large repetitive protein
MNKSLKKILANFLMLAMLPWPAKPAHAAGPNVILSFTNTSSPFVGDLITYSITLNNQGDQVATNVSVHAVFSGTATSAFSAVDSSPQCTSATAGAVDCNNLGNLLPLGTIAIQIVLKASTPGTLHFAAVALPGGSNQSSDLAVSLNADLGITQSGSGSQDKSLPINYTLSIINNGHNDASNVKVVDSWTGPATYNTFSSSDGKFSCILTGAAQVTCSAASVPNGYNGTITIGLTPNNVGEVDNTASISSDIPDNVSTNDTTDPSTGKITLTTGALLSADVTVPSSAVVGDGVNYVAIVHNATGGANAINLKLTDFLDTANLSVNGAIQSSIASASCSGSGPVVCSLPQLNAGSDWTVTIPVKVNSAVPTLSSNHDTVTTDTNVSNVNNLTSVTKTTTLQDGVSLSVATDFNNPTSAALGDPATFKYNLSNGGPRTADPATFTITLGAGVVGVSNVSASYAGSSNGTCSYDGSSSVTCSIPSFASGNSDTVTLVLTPQSRGTLQINTKITAPAGLTNNSSADHTTEQVSITSGADLQLQRSGIPGGVSAKGDGTYQAPLNKDVTFSYSITNKGPKSTSVAPLPLPTVTVSLTGPGSIKSLTVNSTPCTASGTSAICTLPTMAMNDTVQVGLVVQATAAGVVGVTATANEFSDPDTTYNSDTFLFTGATGVNLRIDPGFGASPVSGLSSGASASLNTDLTFAYVVTNATGLEDANAITFAVTFSAPSALTFKSMAPGSVGNCSDSGGIVTCTGVGPVLANSSSRIVSFIMTTAQKTSSVSVTAHVDPDPAAIPLQKEIYEPDNTTGPFGFSIVSGSDLEIASVNQSGLDPSGHAVVGNDLTYNFLVTNNGNLLASNAVFQMDLSQNPSGSTTATFTFGQASVNGTSCNAYNPATHILTCSIPSIAVVPQFNSTLPVSVTINPTSAGQLYADAQVITTPASDDFQPNNNHAYPALTVLDGGDVDITHTGSTGGIGTTLSFPITVTNHGPKSVTTIVVDDTLTGSTFDTLTVAPADSSAGSCTVSGGNAFHCAFAGPLVSGGTDVINVSLNPTGTGTITGLATMTATGDYTTTNNQDSESFRIGSKADIQVLNALPATAVRNATMIYQFTIHNAGPAQAGNVAFTALLPALVSGVTVTPSSTCSYFSVGNKVVCNNFGSVAADGSADILVKITATAPNQLGNMHTKYWATTSSTDSNSANNGTAAVPLDLTTNVVAGTNISGSVTALDYYEVGKPLPTYTLSLSNAGTDAPNVEVDLNAPAGVQIAGVTTSGATCTLTPVPNCVYSTLAANGAIAPITISATAPVTELLNAVLSATIKSPSIPNTNTTVPSKTTNFVRAADLSVAITPIASGIVNQDMTYTVQIANNGAGDALSSQLTYALPTGLQYKSTDDPSQCSFNLGASPNGTLTCSFGTIATGSSKVLSVVVTPKQAISVTSTMTVATTVPNHGTDHDSKTTAIGNPGSGPTADPQTVSVDFNSPGQAITLVGHDSGGSALTYAIATSPVHGALSGSGATQAYKPSQNYSGLDTFTFTVTNAGSITSAAATVTITVGAEPCILSKIVVGPDGQTITFPDSLQFVAHGYCLQHDGTHEIQNLTYTWQSTDGANGSIALGSGLFRTAGNFFGQRQYTVTATNNGVIGTAHVTVLVPSVGGSDDICSAYAYPVPFKANSGSAGVTFTKLAPGAKINIYTTDSRLVKTIRSEDGGNVVWDTKNNDGQSVASWVYLYRIEHGGACAHKNGKLVIIK